MALMEKVLRRENLREAYKRVARNGGAPGEDGMTVEELMSHGRAHGPRIRDTLLDGTYIPQPVRRVEIPKHLASRIAEYVCFAHGRSASDLILPGMHRLLPILLLLSPSLALAQSPGESDAPPSLYQETEPSLPRFSLTWSPFHLFLPVVELTGEIRLADKFGLGLVAGGGRIADDANIIEATVIETGAQARYYVFGNFRHGMQLGAEVLLIYVSSSEIEVQGNGVGIGPFVGYKYMAPFGFTFDAQLGAQYLVAAVEQNDGSASANESEIIPLLNLNIGWSF